MRDLPKILFVAATESDAFSIITQLENPRFYKQHGGVVHGGLWRDASVRVLLTGHDGEVAAAAVREALELDRPLVLMSLGLATALDANLQVGDIVVVQAFEVSPGLNAGGPRKLSGRLFDLVRTFLKQNPSLGSRVGSLVHVDEVPHEPEDKLALFERSRADLADCIGLPIANVAEEWQLPFVILRAVFEQSHERLPEIERMVRDKGKLSTTRLIGRFAANPTSIFSLRGLSGRARTCRDRMDLFADSFWKVWRTVRETSPIGSKTAEVNAPPPAPLAPAATAHNAPAAPAPPSMVRPGGGWLSDAAPRTQTPPEFDTAWRTPPQS